MTWRAICAWPYHCDPPPAAAADPDLPAAPAPAGLTLPAPAAVAAAPWPPFGSPPATPSALYPGIALVYCHVYSLCPEATASTSPSEWNARLAMGFPKSKQSMHSASAAFQRRTSW